MRYEEIKEQRKKWRIVEGRRGIKREKERNMKRKRERSKED